MATEQGGAGGRPPESDKGGGGIISSVTNWFTRGNSQKGSEESQYKVRSEPDSDWNVVVSLGSLLRSCIGSD